ncbi:cwf18 pre-mRNA splicing factor-domain-containing protein [Xylariaceae sp. FL1272]|nr:cwf18 pre-mRNA splicing factor-domain-containing protein [Xylariaceae sp. FL1272]
MSASQATLSAASDDRKARLAKLKTLKRKQPADEIVAPESERTIASPPATHDAPDVSKLHLSGRNYDSETRGPKLGFEAPPTLDMQGPTLEEQAAQVEDDIRQKAADDAKEDHAIDLFKLQPKKPNWDLKRDLKAKLDVLNVRTDNAIAKLVRQRIASATNTAQLAAQDADDGSTEAAGMDGVALVEGLRVREREDNEDERREREDPDLA